MVVRLMEDRSRDFYLIDTASYLFKEAERIGKLGYVPTEADILRSRQKSTAIVEMRLSMGPLHIHLSNASGQRSRYKKWIHCFESVTSVIFCFALSDYDQICPEKSKNCMIKSLGLWESINNSRWFLKTSFILCLTKSDLFRMNIPRIPLAMYFPKYTGGPDGTAGNLNDTVTLQLVFTAIKQTILQNSSKDSEKL